MNYEKPEIRLLVSAVASIQAEGKVGNNFDSITPPTHTLTAYEADE